MLSHHIAAPLDTGTLYFRKGLTMSRADLLSIKLDGDGGHGARTSKEGNVVLAAASLIGKLKNIVNGLAYEGTDCACSVGLLHAGHACNVVPRFAKLEGSLRTFTADQRKEAIKRLDDLRLDIASEFKVTISVENPLSIPPVVNHPMVVDDAFRCTEEMGHLTQWARPIAPSDDISEFLEHIPGCHVFIGAAPQSGVVEHHKSEFDIDERSLMIAVEVLAHSAMRCSRPIKTP